MTNTPTEREAEGALAKLRRRKVVQWGLAYIAGAWAVLQGLAFLADVFGWPYQSKRIATLIMLIGFPTVLVLAWYHGDRGQQRISRPEFAWLVALVLLGGGVLWFYGDRDAPAATSSTVTATQTLAPSPNSTTDTRPSIAVLPFENRSRLEDDAYFVNGIHDDILTQLSKVSALKVISSTSVNRFRNTELSLQQIAEQLGATKILEGGVQRAGDRVRIHVQLIDVATDAHLWAERYDRELTAANIFAIQSDVASAISGALETTLTPAQRTRISAIPTQSLEAWQAYQLGKQQMSSRNSAELDGAERFFRKAIAADPKFALAHVGLADALTLQVYYGGRPKDAVLSDAEHAVATAMKLDSHLAEAWASEALIAFNRRQFERAEQMLRRALALNPNSATAHQWLSIILTEFGRWEEALVLAESAVVLDPLSAIINAWLGNARANVGRFDDALVAYQQAIEIDSAMSNPYLATGVVHARGFGRLDASIPWFEKAASLDPGRSEVLSRLAITYWELGDDAEAGRWLTRALAIGEGTAYSNFVAALLYLDRGDEESAREHAQRAAELDPRYVFLIRDHDRRKGDYASARTRYAKSFPELFAKELPAFRDRDAFAAIDLALVLQHTGESERAKALLDRSEAYLQTIPRMGPLGRGFSDVAIHALRGETVMALAKLREAEQAGWRELWRYHRDFDPNLASIRNEPEFKAIFAEIERDMAQQRARLAARPRDAPLDLAVVPRNNLKQGT